jgi:hypothetical protein
MEKYNMNVLAEAKQEYTRQLVNILYPQIYLGIRSIYNETKNYCEKHGDTNVLKRFQNLLSVIPKWNTDRINDEYKRIVNETDCDWIEDLITAVFVSHTKVLTSIKAKKPSDKNVELDVPSGPYFVHKCYTEVARNFWKRPYLFYHEVSNIEQQRNMAEAETCVKDSIVETVRKLLPVKHILKEYLGGNYEDEDLDEDVTSVMSTTTKNNLRKLVKAEIENTLKESVVEERIPEPILEESPLENNYLPHPENQPEILDNKEEAIQEIVDNQVFKNEIENKETDEPEDQIKEANAELYDLSDENAEIQVNADNNDVITMDENQIAELEKFQEQLDSDVKDDQTSIVVEDRKEPEPEIKMVIIQPTEKEKEKKQTATKKIVEEKESIKEKTSAKSNRDEFEPKPSADDDDDNFSFFDDATEE